MVNAKTSEFWRNILLAAGTEPRDVTALRGASGYSHPIVALGVDENRRRVVMISGESDARSAALAQGDVQAAMPSVKVVMARPIAVNLSAIAHVITEAMGSVTIGNDQFGWIKEHQNEFKEEVDRASSQLADTISGFALAPWRDASLDFLAVIKDAVGQLSLVDVRRDELSESAVPTFDLTQLRLLDPAEADRRAGVCSIPLYELAQETVERLRSRRDIELTTDVLKQHNILQYFFPAADQLALGLAEREKASAAALVEQLMFTPRQGHPFGQPEILDTSVSLQQTVSALREQGLLVEGDAGIEISEEGKRYRATVRFRPREGLISKLSRIFSVKADISLKDIFR